MKLKVYNNILNFKIGVLYILLSIIPSIQILAVGNFIDKVTASFNGSISNKEVYTSCIYILVCLILNLILSELIKLNKIQYIHKTDLKIKDKILTKRSKLKYKYIENQEVCDVIALVEDNPSHKLLSVILSIFQITNILIRILGFVTIIVLKLWWVGILVLFIISIVAFVSYKSGRVKYDAYEESAKHNRRASYIQSILSSRDFAQERKLFNYFNKVNSMWTKQYEKMRDIEYKANVKVFLQLAFSEGFANILILILGIILLYPLHSKDMSVGIYISLVSGSFKIIDIITRDLSENIENLTENISFYKKLKSFFDLEEIENTRSNRNNLDYFKTIEIKNLSFKYPNSDKLILKNLNIKFEFGKSYALVGANGCGKSTLVKLLLGLYEDYDGEILINGIDIKKYHNDELINFQHTILQNFTKYSISIRDYVTLGSHKEITEKDIFKVLEKVGIKQKINTLNNGIDTKLGKLDDDSVDLSGGQWQKLEIARSLIANKPFTILDEPTSAIDPISEMQLYKMFAHAINKRTSLIITHRLGAAKIASKILVLKDGSIKEQGTHDELINLQGTYYTMFEAQRSWYNE